MVGFTVNNHALSGRSILVVEDTGSGRVVTSGYFDASRAELLSLVRRALPSDKELAVLR